MLCLNCVYDGHVLVYRKVKYSRAGFGLLCALMCPREGAVLVLALWRCAGLLLSSLCLCTGTEGDCVFGIVGRAVLLPCLSHELLTVENFSIEWRKDDEVVLRSVWDENGNVETQSLKNASILANASQTGNFSLVLPLVHPREDRMHFSLFFVSGQNQSSPLCTVCLRVAVNFSVPLLEREHTTVNDETTFLCHSTGGYPEPVVFWLIDNAQEPPEGSVRTQTTFDPNSHLYHITSHLTIPVSKDVNVSCIVESMNATMRHRYDPGPVVSRASEAMWLFSTALCVVVGIMVIAGVAYQIHLDKISKRRKKESQQPKRGYKRRWQYREESDTMMSESKETEV